MSIQVTEEDKSLTMKVGELDEMHQRIVDHVKRGDEEFVRVLLSILYKRGRTDVMLELSYAMKREVIESNAI
jgi:hypothetical protein